MSINRIYAGEVAMALVLAASVTDRRKPSHSLASAHSRERSPKTMRGLLRLLRKLR